MEDRGLCQVYERTLTETTDNHYTQSWQSTNQILQVNAVKAVGDDWSAMRFGESVSFKNGKLVIGAPGYVLAAGSTGAVFTYDWNSGTHVFDTVDETIFADIGADYGFGMAVAMRGSDGSIAVGCPLYTTSVDNNGASSTQANMGKVVTYKRTGSSLAAMQNITYTTGNENGLFSPATDSTCIYGVETNACAASIYPDSMAGSKFGSIVEWVDYTGFTADGFNDLVIKEVLYAGSPTMAHFVYTVARTNAVVEMGGIIPFKVETAMTGTVINIAGTVVGDNDATHANYKFLLNDNNKLSANSKLGSAIAFYKNVLAMGTSRGNSNADTVATFKLGYTVGTGKINRLFETHKVEAGGDEDHGIGLDMALTAPRDLDTNSLATLGMSHFEHEQSAKLEFWQVSDVDASLAKIQQNGAHTTAADYNYPSSGSVNYGQWIVAQDTGSHSIYDGRLWLCEVGSNANPTINALTLSYMSHCGVCKGNVDGVSWSDTLCQNCPNMPSGSARRCNTGSENGDICADFCTVDDYNYNNAYSNPFMTEACGQCGENHTDVDGKCTLVSAYGAACGVTYVYNPSVTDRSYIQLGMTTSNDGAENKVKQTCEVWTDIGTNGLAFIFSQEKYAHTSEWNGAMTEANFYALVQNHGEGGWQDNANSVSDLRYEFLFDPFTVPLTGDYVDPLLNPWEADPAEGWSGMQVLVGNDASFSGAYKTEIAGLLGIDESDLPNYRRLYVEKEVSFSKFQTYKKKDGTTSIVHSPVTLANGDIVYSGGFTCGIVPNVGSAITQGNVLLGNVGSLRKDQSYEITVKGTDSISLITQSSNDLEFATKVWKDDWIMNSVGSNSGETVIQADYQMTLFTAIKHFRNTASDDKTTQIIDWSASIVSPTNMAFVGDAFEIGITFAPAGAGCASGAIAAEYGYSDADWCKQFFVVTMRNPTTLFENEQEIQIQFSFTFKTSTSANNKISTLTSVVTRTIVRPSNALLSNLNTLVGDSELHMFHGMAFKDTGGNGIYTVRNTGADPNNAAVTDVYANVYANEIQHPDRSGNTCNVDGTVPCAMRGKEMVSWRMTLGFEGVLTGVLNSISYCSFADDTSISSGGNPTKTCAEILGLPGGEHMYIYNKDFAEGKKFAAAWGNGEGAYISENTMAANEELGGGGILTAANRQVLTLKGQFRAPDQQWDAGLGTRDALFVFSYTFAVSASQKKIAAAKNLTYEMDRLRFEKHHPNSGIHMVRTSNTLFDVNKKTILLGENPGVDEALVVIDFGTTMTGDVELQFTENEFHVFTAWSVTIMTISVLSLIVIFVLFIALIIYCLYTKKNMERIGGDHFCGAFFAPCCGNNRKGNKRGRVNRRNGDTRELVSTEYTEDDE